MSDISRVVVIGGGIAGVSTVGALRAGGYDGELVLIDRAEFPYDRPPLSKEYLVGNRDLTQIALQSPEWYLEKRIELVGNAEVTAIFPGTGEVVVSTRPSAGSTSEETRVIVADRIVLATGGSALRPPIPGSDSPRVHVLRDVEDADQLRAQLFEGARLLVVGAGLIGAETASTAHELGASVVIVDPLDPPIAAAVGPDLARWLHDQHAVEGVEAIATTLESLQETATGIEAQLRGEPDSREFDAVLIGVGMRPSTTLAEAAGLITDRGVVVDEGQVTSHPHVLAVGDSARLRDHPRTEHWEAAQLDGRRAAAAILGTAAPAESAHWFWSDRYHRHVEGVGQMRAADAQHTVVVRGEKGDDPFSVWTLVSTRPSAGSTSEGGSAGSASEYKVLGCAAVDDSTAVRAARRMIDRGTVVDPAAIADPATDLRKLLRG